MKLIGTLTLLFATLLAAAGASAAEFQEANTNRWGADYRRFAIADGGANACADTCAADQACRAWTFVKPGVEGPAGICKLKSRVAERAPDPCCISGVAIGATVQAAPAGITAAIARKPALANDEVVMPGSAAPASDHAATAAPMSLTPAAWSNGN